MIKLCERGKLKKKFAPEEFFNPVPPVPKFYVNHCTTIEPPELAISEPLKLVHCLTTTPEHLDMPLFRNAYNIVKVKP